jgi:hypothetical protein
MSQSSPVTASVMAVYSDLPETIRNHLAELETFIGDCDGQWTSLQTSDANVVLDNGTIDAGDAVKAFNGIVAALRSFGFAQTPDLEAAVGRVMRIRNGMILDGDAEALIRKEIGALMGSHAQRPKEPVAWRYQGRVGWGDVWRLSEIDPTKTEGFFESPEGWVVQPLFASPDTSTVRETGK